MRRFTLRPTFERLEVRDTPTTSIVLVGTTRLLKIVGTSAADTIKVVQNPTTTNVSVNGVTSTFANTAFDRVGVYGGPGSDLIDERGLKTIPTTNYGGDGNDVFLGGGARDLFYGGGGNDSMRGGPGFDLFNGGAGFDTAYTGPYDQKPVTAIERVFADMTDGPAFGQTSGLGTILSPVNPGLSSNKAYLYAPAGNSISANALVVSGTLASSATNQVFVSSTANTSVANTPVTVVSVTTNGNRHTLVFSSPVAIPQAQARRFEVRLPLGVSIVGVYVTGEHAALQII